MKIYGGEKSNFTIWSPSFPHFIKSSKLSPLNCVSNLIYLTLTSTWELVMVISDRVLVFGKDKRMGAGRGEWEKCEWNRIIARKRDSHRHGILFLNRKILDTELKRERKSVGGLPSQRVKCHLIKGLMNELRAKIFGGALKRRPCPRGGGGVWRVPGPRYPQHHVGGKVCGMFSKI